MKKRSELEMRSTASTDSFGDSETTFGEVTAGLRAFLLRYLGPVMRSVEVLL